MSSVEPDGSLTGALLPPRFESVRLLGRGGMGAVFLAWDPVLCRHVAVKILAQELAGDAVMRERFAREAALAGRLGTHPHVVTAYEAGEWQHRPYVVFEYMPNGSLADRLAENGMPPRSKTMRWLGQIADALDHAHTANVVHRDIKPSNLLLDADDNVSVADFGVSRRDGETTLTAQGEVVGTAGYLAPEQVDGRGATAASDRFALGVVAYQLLTGKLPTVNRRRLEASVEAVFDRALAEEPDRRYPSATAFVDALQQRRRSDPRADQAEEIPAGVDDSRRSSGSAASGPAHATDPVVACRGRRSSSRLPSLRRRPREESVLGRRLARDAASPSQLHLVVTRCAVRRSARTRTSSCPASARSASAAPRHRRSRRKGTPGHIAPTRDYSRRTAATRPTSAASAGSREAS